MGTHMIPRNTKGENRILFIFSTKALIFTAVGGRDRLIILLAIKNTGYGSSGICIYRPVCLNRIYMWNI